MRYHFIARSTLAGNSASFGADVDTFEVNDADDTTYRILAGLPAYPTAGATYVSNYGRVGAVGTSSNNTLTNSGGAGQTWKANLAGSNTWTSGNNCFQVDVQNGEYDVWIATGSGTAGTADGFILWDDSFQDVLDGVTGQFNAVSMSDVKLWADSTAFATNDFVIAPDGGVWKVTTGGTTSTTDPSGGVRNDTFVTGTATLTHTGRFALAWGIQTVGGSTILDQNGAAVAASSWPGSAKRVTVANGHLTITRNSTACRWRELTIDLVVNPLVDCTVYDSFNQEDSTPDVWAQQVEGYRAGRVTFSNGATDNITLNGTGATYFDIEVDGANIYFTQNDTPIPDGLAGAMTLGIVQTDAAAPNSPYTTNVSLNVISSNGRTNLADGTVDGDLCTQSWLNIQATEAVHATHLWTGYDDVTAFTTDVAVNNHADFLTAVADAEAASTGTSWHRIRLQNGGTFVGDDSLTHDFGDGGLLVEPDTGHDPEFNSQFYGFNVCGFHIRNTLCPCDKTAFANTTNGQFRGVDPGATGINGGGRALRFAATGNRIGVGHLLTMDHEDDKQIAGYLAEAIAERGKNFYTGVFAESVYIVDNIIDGGSDNAMFNLAGTRAGLVKNNLLMRCLEDQIGGGGISSPTSDMNGFFADNSPYIIIEDNVSVREPGFPEFSSGAHADFWQSRTPAQNASFWYANSGEENDIGNPWEVNDLCYMQSEDKWYRVAAITTGITGGTGPSGTGTGIVDGGVTWDFEADNSAIGVTWRIVIRNNDMISACDQMADDPARQFNIGSASGFGITQYHSVYNNTNSSTGDKGVNTDEGWYYLEHNCWGGPPEINSGSDWNACKITVRENANVISRKNITQGVTALDEPGLIYEHDLVVLEWDVSAATTENEPGAYLQGPFTTATYNNAGTPDTMYIVQGVDNSGNSDIDTVREQIRSAFYTIQGDNGIWPIDLPPDVDNEAIKSTVKLSVSLGF